MDQWKAFGQSSKRIAVVERFTNRESIVKMIENYIEYYNNKRLQRNLGVLTPMKKHEMYLEVT